MGGPSTFQKQLLRWIAEGRRPTAEVKSASTLWRMGDISVTRDINRLRGLGLIRMWRGADMHDQRMEITDAGREMLA